MKIIKLNAIASTNDYLKAYVKENNCDDFTVVCANFQTNGKGQMSNKWHSKKDKNLLFSVLVKDVNLRLNDFFKLHVHVSLAIYSVLTEVIPDIKIKWPNDIMSRKKKLAGILIENSVKNGIINQSIIGIGLNVNQLDFPESFPNATSVKNILGKEMDKDELLSKIVSKIKERLGDVQKDSLDEYLEHLYQFNVPSMYQDYSNNSFLGIIKNISKQGNLLIELENESIKEFAFKEIKFL